MKIVFWGTPIYAIPSLNLLFNSDHEIICVITQPDKRRGRGNKLIPSPIKEIADRQSIPVITPERITNNKEFLCQLKNINADIYIVVAFGQILPKEVLDIPKFGCWNSHASLLPKWRGAAPIQWSLMNGDKQTGVGIMSMEETLDTGPIITQRVLEIEPMDNYFTLSEKLSLLSAELLLETVETINSKQNNKKDDNIPQLKLISQSELSNEETSYARMIKKEDYKINWKTNSIDINRKVNALYPNAYSLINTKRLKITKTKVITSSDIDRYKDNFKLQKYLPGTIISSSCKGLLVTTIDGYILIEEAKIEGRNSNYAKNNINNQNEGLLIFSD